MALSKQQQESFGLSGGVMAIALLLPKNVILLLFLVTMLAAVVTFILIAAQRQKALNATLEQQVEARTLQLQISMAELEAVSSLQDLLLYTISHDLRTTVMGSLMVLETMQGQAGDTILVSRQLLQRMTQSGKTQLNHLNQLLEAYSNITDGIQLKKSRVSISAVLQEAIAALLSRLQENQITLINFTSTDPLWVMADADKIRQVFDQLITNAISHNSPGIEIQIEAIVETSTLQLMITDTGVGISSPEQQNIFELCLKPPQERQLTRISLGLCLCKQIVTAHGGQIFVHSQVGEGTKIAFTLPINGEGRQP